MDTRHLKRRRQTWYVRVRVPEPLRDRIGKSEIVQSLKTRDLAEARRLRHAALNQILEQFASMEADEKAAGWVAPAIIISAARSARGRIDHGEAHEKVRREWDAAMDAWAADEFPEDPTTFEPVLPPAFDAATDLAGRILKGQAGDLLSSALEDHTAEIKPRVRNQTLKARERRVKAFKDWLGMDTEVRSITREIAGRYVNHLVQKPGSTKTKKDNVSDLSAFFAWCMERGYIELNPFANMTRSIRDTTRGDEKKAVKRRPWNRDELKKLLTAIDARAGRDDALWSMTLIAMFTGMRAGEIAELQLEDVYNDRIHIPEGKTESSVRDVPIHPTIRPLVKQLAASSKDGYLIEGLKRGGEDKKRHHGFSKRFGYFIRKHVTEDKRLVFHSLRKSFITELENSGCPENLARQIVGHEKQSITYGLYSGGVELDKLAERVAAVSYGEEVDRLIQRGA